MLSAAKHLALAFTFETEIFRLSHQDDIVTQSLMQVGQQVAGLLLFHLVKDAFSRLLQKRITHNDFGNRASQLCLVVFGFRSLSLSVHSGLQIFVFFDQGAYRLSDFLGFRLR